MPSRVCLAGKATPDSLPTNLALICRIGRIKRIRAKAGMCNVIVCAGAVMQLR